MNERQLGTELGRNVFLAARVFLFDPKLIDWRSALALPPALATLVTRRNDLVLLLLSCPAYLDVSLLKALAERFRQLLPKKCLIACEFMDAQGASAEQRLGKWLDAMSICGCGSLAMRKYGFVLEFTEVRIGERCAVSPVAPRTLFARSSTVAVGGSFDHMHEGHLLMLFCALQRLRLERGVLSTLVVGLMPDSSLRAKNEMAALMGLSFAARAAALRSCVALLLKSLGFATLGSNLFLNTRLRASVRLEMRALDERGLGVAEQMRELRLLVVSEETVKGGAAIQRMRAAAGLPALSLVVVPLLYLDARRKVSSTIKRCLDGSSLEEVRERFAALLSEVPRRAYARLSPENAVRAMITSPFTP